MMRRINLREIWPAEADEVVGAEVLKTYAEAGEESPWPIRALMGFGAWLAAFLLMLFMFAIVDGDEGLVFFGLIAIVMGVALRHGVGAGRIFYAQFALSLSLAGHALVIMHLSTDDNTVAAMAAIALGVAALWAFPDPVHRFLSTMLAVLGLAWLSYEVVEASWILEIVAVLTAIALAAAFEFEVAWQRSQYADLQLPAGFGLAAAFALLLLPSLIGELDENLIGGTAPLATRAFL